MRLPYGTVCEVLWAQDVALTVCKCTPEEVYDQCVEGIIGMTRDQLYKIGLPRKSILGDYFQENMTS